MKDKEFLDGYYNCSGVWERELMEGVNDDRAVEGKIKGLEWEYDGTWAFWRKTIKPGLIIWGLGSYL